MSQLSRNNFPVRNDRKSPLPHISPETWKLKIYTQTKLAMAERLRIIKESLAALGRENAEKQIESLMVKLAEDRFTLAVLGQFKRGKSSLMNAIIGKEALPTGLLPVTSAVTVVKYGPEEKLVIHRNQSVFPEEFPVADLPLFVTEKGNPGNEKHIDVAYLEMPVSFLRRGIEFVDTPGVGSTSAANTKTTLDFLPQCDAALFVTSVDSPLSQTELDFLKTTRQYVSKIFYVVNKIDLITRDELNEFLGYLNSILQNEAGLQKADIFPVSARIAPGAPKSGDGLNQLPSGLGDLETELAFFLTEKRFNTLLRIVARKALQVLQNETDLERFDDIGNESETSEKYAEALKGLRNAREDLELLYGKVIQTDAGTEKAVEFSLPEKKYTPVSGKKQLVFEMNEQIDIREDLDSRECPVCHYLTKYSFDLFSKWQYKIGKDEEIRDAFARELGFCPLHTWQLISLCSPRGASVGFARLSEEISEKLQKASHLHSTVDIPGQWVHDFRNCRVCRNLSQAEKEYLGHLATLLNTEEGLSRFKRSQGVCIRHLGMLLNIVKKPLIKDILLSHTSEKFAEDAEDMRNFTLKNTALRRNLQNRDENEAWLRTAARIAGSRGIAMPWSEEKEI